MSDRLRSVALCVVLALFCLVAVVGLVRGLLLPGFVAGAGAVFAAFMLSIHLGNMEDS